MGKQMTEFANSRQKGKFVVSAQAVSFLGSPSIGRVDIAVDFPDAAFEAYEDPALSDARRPEPNAKMAILGLVYGKDGSLAARFSDSQCYSISYSNNYPVKGRLRRKLWKRAHSLRV
jgi:hypothetical protein